MASRVFELIPKQPLRALLSLGGVVGLGFMYVMPSARTQAEVGELAPVVARPAELAEVRSLDSGQTLDQVLGGFIDGNDRQSVLVAFQEQASPRRMKVGTEVTIRYRASDHWLRGVDVALNPDSTVRLTRDDIGWRSTVVQTPTRTDTLYASGRIEDVLWNAVVHNDALDAMPVHDRALLIHHLDQVFQWEIDFSRQIQKGDEYRFAFERQVRPDGSMRAGHLIAAELVNSGTPYEAVWFESTGDDRGAYFDLDGKSVRRAFLLKPLEFRRISSQYTNSRFHPILKTWRAHRGIDYATASGTEIQATGDGVVTHRGPLGALGNAVVIRHPNGFITRYGHMSRFQAKVKAGTRVHQGDVIGYVGMTGLATAPHLHYELWTGGHPVDPLKINLPPGDPVPASDRSRWEIESLARMGLLGPPRRLLASSAGGK
ncbi:MAG: M23 family metallopeptidase [Gemmatimonadetes bacterium]|nr:M23 family metallopeptidase [Gemmatimonadota bacterium]